MRLDSVVKMSGKKLFILAKSILLVSMLKQCFRSFVGTVYIYKTGGQKK